MELKAEERAAGEEYLSSFDVLIGDRRTQRTFREVVYGVIGGESLKASQIARFSPWAGSLEVW